MTKVELKKQVTIALLGEYGFAPQIKQVDLLEASWDGEYILASINGIEYEIRGNKVYR